MSAAPPIVPAALLADLEVPEHERWAEFIRRRDAWREDNPGATPWEVKDFAACVREECGL